MSAKFNLTGHKALWNWLADNPGMRKLDYFLCHNIALYTKPIDNCYACAYAYKEKQSGKDALCNYCPLCVKERGCLNGLYNMWTNTINRLELQPNYLSNNDGFVYEDEYNSSLFCPINKNTESLRKECSKIARQIANLPVREGVECE